LTITTSVHELAASKARTNPDPTCPVPPTTKTRKPMLDLSSSNIARRIFKRDSVAAYERLGSLVLDVSLSQATNVCFLANILMSRANAFASPRPKPPFATRTQRPPTSCFADASATAAIGQKRTAATPAWLSGNRPFDFRMTEQPLASGKIQLLQQRLVAGLVRGLIDFGNSGNLPEFLWGVLPGEGQPKRRVHRKASSRDRICHVKRDRANAIAVLFLPSHQVASGCVLWRRADRRIRVQLPRCSAQTARAAGDQPYFAHKFLPFCFALIDLVSDRRSAALNWEGVVPSHVRKAR